MTKELVAVDHELEGSLKVLYQYRDSPNFKVLLNTFTSKLNEFEDEITKFKTQLQLSTALGANLDLFGDMLNSPFRPIDDETYRLVLYGLIAAYNSEGRASDIMTLITNLVVADDYIVFDSVAPASFGIQITGAVLPPDPSIIAASINLAKAAGVEFEGVTVIGDFEPIFSFATDTSSPIDEGTFDLFDPGIAYYTQFVYEPNGVVAVTNRIKEQVFGGVSNFLFSGQELNLNAFVAEVPWDTPSTYFGITDSAGAFWEFTRNAETIGTPYFFKDGLEQAFMRFQRADVTTYYQDYFYDPGPLDDSRRIFVSGNGVTVIDITFVFPSGTHIPFLTETSNFRSNNGYLGFRDANFREWIFTGTGVINSLVNGAGNTSQFVLSLLTAGVAQCTVTRNGVASTLATFASEYVTYTEANKATYDSNNPNGLIYEPSGAPVDICTITKDSVPQTVADVASSFAEWDQTMEAQFNGISGNPDGFPSSVPGVGIASAGYYSLLIT